MNDAPTTTEDAALVAPHPAAPVRGVETHALFTVPWFSWRPDDGPGLADDLARVVLARRDADPGVTVTNVGGWHSRQDLLTWDDPSVRAFEARILDLVCHAVRATVVDPRPQHLTGWRAEAWANVNGHGASNKAHVHTRDGNLWSGVFYVDEGETGQGDVGGRTCFQDRSGVPEEVGSGRGPFSREVHVAPEKGRFILFPGTAWHSVERYAGHAPRITLAFNLTHPAFVVPRYEPEDFWWTNFRFAMRGKQVVGERLRGRLGRSRGTPSAD